MPTAGVPIWCRSAVSWEEIFDAFVPLSMKLVI
jgi:hypothetical protein